MLRLFFCTTILLLARTGAGRLLAHEWTWRCKPRRRLAFHFGRGSALCHAEKSTVPAASTSSWTMDWAKRTMER